MMDRIYKSKKKMGIRSNRGKMYIYHKVVVAGYIKDVWFDKTIITNIFALKNLIQKYRVTYDILDQMFNVHCKEINKPNMHFRMHESGLHYYDPDENFSSVTIAVENRKHYSKE